MYVDMRDQLLGNWTEITVSVWEQRQYDAPLAGVQASQGRERKQSVAALSIWEALYYTVPKPPIFITFDEYSQYIQNLYQSYGLDFGIPTFYTISCKSGTIYGSYILLRLVMILIEHSCVFQSHLYYLHTNCTPIYYYLGKVWIFWE